MFTKIINKSVYVALLCFCTNIQAVDSVVIDPDTGNFIVTYESNGQVVNTVIVSSKHIKPEVKSRVTLDSSSDNKYKYMYRLENEEDSQQPIVSFVIDGGNIDSNSLASPDGWSSVLIPSEIYGNRIGWRFKRKAATDGLQKDEDEDGFNYLSSDLPGVDISRVRGGTTLIKYKGYGPDEKTTKEINKLIHPDNDSVKMVVIAPKIKVSSPINIIETLASFSEHIEEMKNKGFVTNELFVTVSTKLSTAINYAKSDNSSAMLATLEALEEELGDYKEETHTEEDNIVITFNSDDLDEIALQVRDLIIYNVNEIIETLDP